MGLSEAEKAALKDIKADGMEDNFSGKARAERPKTPFYKLLNCSPKATDEERAAFTPGIRVGDDVVSKINAVILYTSDGRKLVRKVEGKFTTTCCSYDGESPAPKIESPECAKLTTDGLVGILSKFKGYDKVKVDAKVAELTEDGALRFCSIKTANDYIPMCPKARWNEDAGVAGPCKPCVHMFAYDLDRNVVFKMELTGRSISANKKFSSPLAEYRKWLGQNRVNCYAFKVELLPAKDGAFYHLDIQSYIPLVDADERARMKQLAHDTFERYQRSANWTPKTQEQEQAPPVVVDNAPIKEALGDDDLAEDVDFD